MAEVPTSANGRKQANTCNFLSFFACLMTSDEWLRNYTTLNDGFTKRLVFRFGIDSGFFSNYNNMLLAMLFCLKHRIRFELYADHAPFTFRDGWSDFFEPFPAVNTQWLNKNYNLRPYIITHSKEAPLQKIVKYRYITGAYRAVGAVDYLTQDLWDFHRDPDFANTLFTIPELGWQQTSLLIATQDMIRALWRYNAPSAAGVAAYTAAVSLPADYISLHVRAGDKFTETKMFDFSEYMGPAQQFSPNREAFIFTDDYTVFEQLQQQYPNWHFYTLCQPNERGYFHNDFIQLEPQHKYQQHLKLFANLDLCARATKFLGTYSSNPGMFMGMRIGPERCYCLDFDYWLIW